MKLNEDILRIKEVMGLVVERPIAENERLIESEEEQKVLRIPSLKFFGQNPLVGWRTLREFLESKGNPLYSIDGDLNLSGFRMDSLGNLKSVSGSLYLKNTPLESLGNLQSVGEYLDISSTPITSLGDLQSVGGHFFLRDTPLESFGKLTYVGGSLILENTPLSKMYSEEQIREMINVGGRVSL